MIVDLDDFHASNHGLYLLSRLKEANPAFKATLFAVPALGSAAFWDSIPDWLELAVHGWRHETPVECIDWPREAMEGVIASKPAAFVRGFKAPGWQISDGCYEALDEAGWWVADQPYNDDRRPAGLRVHRLGDGDHWHGHVQDVCGNGLAECFDVLLARVRAADSFQFISEVAE